MPQVVRKSRRAVDEDQEETPAVETAAPVKERRPETMHEREQVGLEVASDLTLGGMATFLSVTIRGVNLVAASAELTAFVPVRAIVVEDGERLMLRPDEARTLSDADGVVAFLVGPEDDRTRYYVPVADYLARTELRDARHMADADGAWLRPFKGHAGVKRAFGRLVK